MNQFGTILGWDFFLQAAAFLFLLDWIFYLPLFRPLLAKEYGREWKAPTAGRVILTSGLWLLALGLAGFGPSSLRVIGWGALWVIFRHFFIEQRWRSVRRGCGAPGFMSHWAALWIFFVELARLADGTGWLVGQIFGALRMDFAIIMLCAGSYKVAVGFWRGNGMEFGRVNPIWGYHWKYFSGKNPEGLYPRLMNMLASGGEILAGVLLLVPHPWAQLAGAALVSLSFFYVSLFIRLGRLAWLMVLLPAFYIPEVLTSAQVSSPLLQIPPPWLWLAATPFWLFMAMLPFLKFTQYYNLFGNRALPPPLQNLFAGISNFIPVIVWRVFTPDVINFFVRIARWDGTKRSVVVDETSIYSYHIWRAPWLKLRFLHVCESIALVSVFTTLKYFPSKPELFEERLTRYAKSVVADLDSACDRLEFEYVAIQKAECCWEFRPVLRYLVDLQGERVTSEVLEPGFDPAKPALFSPVRESSRPGTFEPVSRA